MKFHDLFPHSLIGLDIQPTCVRMLQVKKSRHGWVGERIAERRLPPEIHIDGKIKNWGVLSAILIEWIDRQRAAGMSAAIQVPAHMVHTKRIQLPRGLSADEIMAEIRLKVKRDLPGMTDALSIDFSEATLNAAADRADMEVIFTVCRQEYLLRYKECIETSGLRVKIIDVDAYALLRAAYLDPALSSFSESLLFLHATPEKAALGVFHLHELVFYQTWDFISRQDFLQRLNSNMELCMTSAPSLMFAKVRASVHSSINMWLQQEPAWCDRIITIDPFAHLKLAKSFDLPLASNHFLIALGLALREVPLW